MDQRPEATLEALERASACLVDGQRGGAWWRVAQCDLGEAVVRLEALITQLTLAQADVVREAASRGVPGSDGARSVAGWVAQLLPLTSREAGRVAGLADLTADPELRPVDDALRTGSVSADRALLVASTVRTLPACVDPGTRAEATAVLTGYATQLDTVSLQRLAKHLAVRLDPDGGEKLRKDEDAVHRDRTLTLREDPDGSWQLRGRLGQVAGQAVAAAVHALAKPAPAHDGTPDPRTTGQRQADALEQLAHRALAVEPGEPGALPQRGMAPPRVVLHVDLATVTARLDDPGLSCATSDTGTPVSPTQLSLLLCDAQLEPHLRDPLGHPLDVGDTVYAFPPRIRRAIIARDRHCTYATCTAPASWCHAHHLTPFGRGGPTSERNGALLCGRHHRHVHAAGLTGRLHGDRVTWHPPDRDSHPDPERHPRAAAGRSRPARPIAAPPTTWAVARALDQLVDRQRRRALVALRPTGPG